MYIFSHYHSLNSISSLANYMAKLLWEWKPRFAVALVVRGLLIVTSHTNCDVTNCPVVMRRYANADGDEQRYKMSKTHVSLACDRGRIEIDHLYGLRCRGWYCNPEQHSLCRPARPQAAGTTRAVPDCSTNHSSADRIVVNSYTRPHQRKNTHLKHTQHYSSPSSEYPDYTRNMQIELENAVTLINQQIYKINENNKMHTPK